MTEQLIRLEQIRIDGNTQSRIEIDIATVKEYKDAMEEMPREHIQFPPLCIIQEGANMWLVDGFHRYRAAMALGLTHFRARIETGTLEQAQWKCLSVNIKNGLRRTKQDKHNVVVRALLHPTGQELTDRAIADHCGVVHSTVRDIREALSKGGIPLPPPPPKQKGRNDKMYVKKESKAPIPRRSMRVDQCYHAPECDCHKNCGPLEETQPVEDIAAALDAF